MYKLSYIDRLPERPRAQYAMGRSIHRAIELFHTDDQAPAPLEDFLGFLQDNWDIDGYASEQQEEEHKELAVQMLTQFHDQETRNYSKPFAVEHGFKVTLDGIPFVGRIDIINKLEDGTLEVLDYKSGRGEYTEEDVKENPQLGLYQLAVEAEYKVLVSRFTIHKLRFGRKVSAPALDDEGRSALTRALVCTANLIEGKMFEPHLGEDCPCDWPDYCPYFKDLFKNRGQTTLVQHDKASVAGPGGRDIISVVKEYATLVGKGEGGNMRAKELEVVMRTYCTEMDILRIIADDIAVTLVCETDPSGDDWHWRFEMGRAPRLEGLE